MTTEEAQAICDAVGAICPDEIKNSVLAVYTDGQFTMSIRTKNTGADREMNTYNGTLDRVTDPVEYLSRVLKHRFVFHDGVLT